MLEESLLNTLKAGFATSMQKIRIPSLGDGKREYSFREPSVREVETISKVILSNSDSQSTVYASTLVFMKYLSLDSDFNPYKINELDRLKIITYILSGIFFSKNLTIKCNRVGCNNSFPYSMKYGDVIKKIDSVVSREFVFENSTDAGKMKITASFPTTERYLEFLEFVDGIKNTPVEYESFNDSFVEIDSTKTDSSVNSSVSSADSEFIEKIKKRREILKKKIEKTVENGDSILGNVDIKSIGNKKTDKNGFIESSISNLYLKRMFVSDIPNSEDEFDINFDGLTYEETEKVLGVIPMRLVIRDDGSNFMTFIRNEVEKVLNSCSPDIRCPNCGHNISKNLGVQNFFIHG